MGLITERVPYGNPADLYQEKYVAFLDVLGFQAMIDRLAENPDRVLEIRGILQDVHRSPHVDIPQFADSGLDYRSISDAVAMFSQVSAAGLAHMFAAVETIASQLLGKGYFLRGAIVKGRLYHDEHQTFGEGLVRAYKLESQIARYPRVMLPQEVVKDANEYQAAGHLSGMFEGQVRASKDGPRHLHILRLRRTRLDRLEGERKQRGILELVEVKNLIERRFTEAFDVPSHFEKVQWFTEYWNAVFSDVRELRIYGPGLAGAHSFL